MSYSWLIAKQKVLADQISDLMAEARTVDAQEDARFGPGKWGDILPAELANCERRAAALAQARESIGAEAADWARTEAKARDRVDEDQVITGSADAAVAAAVPKPTVRLNFTDPDARLMKTADGSCNYPYDAQAVVDVHHQVIIATPS